MIVYYDESILSYVASIRKYFGLSSSYKANDKFMAYLDKQKPKKVFVLLVDGMGSNLIKRKLSEDSFLRKNMLYEVLTVFPSTTTAATISILNGKSPNENAWLAWTQYIKEVSDVIIPFYGCSYYGDKQYDSDLMMKLYPINPIYDELNSKNIKATSLYPAFKENGYNDFDAMCRQLIKYSNHSDYEFAYAYWDKYDTYMHNYGPNNKICDSYLEYINDEIEYLANHLNQDTLLVVLADHGQVEVKESYNLYDSKYEKYFRLPPSLESRAQAFFIKEGMKDDFRKEFINEFEDRFVLLDQKQVLDLNIFGSTSNHERLTEFIGDFLAIGKSTTVFAYQEGYYEEKQGQHAGMLDDEMMVPIIMYKNTK